MTGDERALVAASWGMKGLGEHASVAAFARFVLHLMRLAAPPELVLGAIRAMEDEVLHARLCFGVVRRLTGEAVGPGELDLSSVIDDSDDPAAILEAAIVEGCVNETISVGCAEVAVGRTDDPGIRRVLERIIEDEKRHADLSWQFLEWMLAKYPALAATAEACFAKACATPSSTIPDEPEVLERYGDLVARSRAQVRQDVLREVIAPRRAALLRIHMPAANQ